MLSCYVKRVRSGEIMIMSAWEHFLDVFDADM